MKKFRFMCVMVLVLAMSVLFQNREDLQIYQAATSYTDAKEFYNSTGEGKNYHAEMVNGSIYYATRAKTAHSSTNLRYRTIGFDVSLSAGGVTVSFAVQRDDSSYLRNTSSISDGTYVYNLYVIDEKALYELAELSAGRSAVEKLTAEAVVQVRMDAVMTSIRGTKMSGAVKENGQGGLTESGTVYHLRDESDLQKMKDLFSGHDFKSYKEIEADLENYALTLDYNVAGTKDDNIGCTSTVSVGNGYAVSKDYLYYNGKEVLDTYRVLQQFTLPDVTKKGIDLKKSGYHLPEDKEWKTSDGRTFSDSMTYMPKDIEPMVGFKNTMVVLYANWQPNTYTVSYNAAGGRGSIPSTTHIYDNAKEEHLARNTFSRNGYCLPEGAEWVDADGNTYASGASVRNLTAGNGAEIILYANWQPSIVMIQTEKAGGTGGTDVFYEKYGVGFSLDEAFTSPTDYIRIPSKIGYTFAGYCERISGKGVQVTGSNGKLYVSPEYFSKNSVIYAQYEAQTFLIAFDRQGGYAGSDSVTAAYGKVLPEASAPVRNGYTFKGYFTEPGGNGERYYNEFMAPLSSDGKEVIYEKLSDMTLYAYWEDTMAPDLYFVASTLDWTNRSITLNATAVDNGAGLKKLIIFQGETPVAVSEGLDGAAMAELQYKNTTEGVVSYRAEAEDLNGNTVEAYLTVKYDITPPTGEILDFVVGEDGSISIIVDVTDTKTQQ